MLRHSLQLIPADAMTSTPDSLDAGSTLDGSFTSTTTSVSSLMAVRRWQSARNAVLRQAHTRSSSLQSEKRLVLSRLRRVFMITRLFSVKRHAVEHAPHSLSAQPAGNTSDEAVRAEFEKRSAAFLSAKQGWRGTHYDCHREGIFEDHGSLTRRRMLRLLPEVTTLVEEMWRACNPQMGRVSLASYADYHLSCFIYIQEKETPGDSSIDLIDAWESAIDDWISDTQGSLDHVQKRVLHFQLFRDSIFELVDLYTPTLDGERYVAYLKVLIKAITVTRGGTREIRHRWHKAQPSRDATELCRALRDQLTEEQLEHPEAAIESVYESWLEAQREAGHESGDSSGNENDVECLELNETKVELNFNGFLAGCARHLPSLASLPSDDDEARQRIDLFRRFDVDGSGLISRDNFKAVVLHDAPSSWLHQSSVRTKSRSQRDLRTAAFKFKAVVRMTSVSRPRGATEESPKKTSLALASKKLVTVTGLAAASKLPASPPRVLPSEGRTARAGGA